MRIVVVNTGPTFEELADQAQQAVEQGLNLAANEAKADFESTVQTWEHKPGFTIDVEAKSRTIGTDDDLYFWVSEGTKRSGRLLPKTGKALWLPEGWNTDQGNKTFGWNEGMVPTGDLRSWLPASKANPRNYIRGQNLFRSLNKSSIKPREFEMLIARIFDEGGRLAEIIEQELAKLPG